MSETVEAEPIAQEVIAQEVLATKSIRPPHLLGFEELDYQAVRVDRMISSAVIGVLAFAGLIVMSILAVTGVLPLMWAGVSMLGGLALIGLIWAFVFWYPSAAYRNAGWRLTEAGLEIRRGVFWRSEISIPRDRVQHVDVHQGPIARPYGLAKVVVHTAGTLNASVELDGINYDVAQKLRERIVAMKESGNDGV